MASRPCLRPVCHEAEALMAKAKELGQRWMKGVSADKAWLILRTQVE